MARLVTWGLIWSVASLLPACGFIEKEMAIDPVVTTATPLGATLEKPGTFATFNIDHDCLADDRDANDKKNKCRISTYAKIASARDADGASIDPVRLALLRNRLQDHLIWRSEQVCDRHRAGILATQAGVNFSLNSLTTAVTGAATLITGNLAKSILAAVGGGSNAVRSHFNEDFFHRYVAPAVVRSINALRESELRRITAKRGQPFAERQQISVAGQADPAKPPQLGGPAPVTLPPRRNDAYVTTINDYSLDEALADVERYHQQCSFTIGLSELVDPKLKFADSRAGLRTQIADLRKDVAENVTLIGQLRANGQGANADALQRSSADIIRQIEILSLRLATAPDESYKR